MNFQSFFENPIKGSVGGACKKIAGLVYGIGIILIIVMLISSVLPIFSDKATTAYLSTNLTEAPAWLQSRIRNEINDGLQEIVNSWFNDANNAVTTQLGIKLFWTRIWILTAAIWTAIKSWLTCFAVALGLNIVGEITNSLALIAYRMQKPEQARKE